MGFKFRVRYVGPCLFVEPRSSKRPTPSGTLLFITRSVYEFSFFTSTSNTKFLVNSSTDPTVLPSISSLPLTFDTRLYVRPLLQYVNKFDVKVIRLFYIEEIN